MPRLAVLLLIALLYLPCAMAATLHGTVYDFDLTERNDTIVSIDTSPRQQIVAKDGTYSFILPPGEYNLTASYPLQDLRVEETVVIRDDGDYTLDLILFPDLDEDDTLLTEDVDLSGVEGDEAEGTLWYIVGVLVVALGIGIWMFRKRGKSPQHSAQASSNKEELDEPLAQVMAALAKEGGRITQRDLRAALPYSEAKISLLITDLESRSLVRKIKKGRGNIIVKR